MLLWKVELRFGDVTLEPFLYDANPLILLLWCVVGGSTLVATALPGSLPRDLRAVSCYANLLVEYGYYFVV